MSIAETDAIEKSAAVRGVFEMLLEHQEKDMKEMKEFCYAQ